MSALEVKGPKKKKAEKPGPTPASTPSQEDAPQPPSSAEAFPIVGMGASAGGLEAFEQFFRNASPTGGMAYVLVPHLDPSHASILTEIIQRATTMPVVEAQDQMRVVRNHVYVIPPNREMVIYQGALLLSAPERPRGQRMPIDGFLRSLGENYAERAVGIILSGTGTDGTLGLRAIVGAGGVGIVQDPATARFDGMPSSAIQAGYATYVLSVEKMPAALNASIRDMRLLMPAAAAADPSWIARILMTLCSATGHDFGLYKKSTIRRRIERRMSQHGIDNGELYASYLKEHPKEISVLFKELLINVTSFFRDPEAFVALKDKVFPQLLAERPAGSIFRCWVAACATGEEAYSIAMLLREYMDENEIEFRVQLFSTDLDDDAIAVARSGLYPPNIAADVSPERLRRFFIREDRGYRVKKEIREMVVFAVQNIIKDPPFTKLDLLSCRNLMIYLEPELQQRLIPIFHYALKSGGVLLLSPSESTGSYSELFTTLDRKWKLYSAIHSHAFSRVTAVSDAHPPVGAVVARDQEKPSDHPAPADFSDLARRALLQSYAPASVVTDLRGNILFVYGDTGRYLRPAPGQATLNVVEMARDGLQLELRAAIRAGSNLGQKTVRREVSVKYDGGFHTVALSVRPLPDSESGRSLILVSFEASAAGEQSAVKRGRSKLKAGPEDLQRLEEVQRELAYMKENLQATIEEQQASNEELKSTNEEMQSTNEELQSTNEELETSKEELQSVNEELITVNSELQAKIEQLASMQNDMKNLLDNLSIGIVFLDENMAVRRFTRDVSRIYRLVNSDVGRSLGDIKSDIEGEDLLVAARSVIETLIPCEREVRVAGGAYYLVRIQPYRTVDNVIAGVVLTFTDISKRIEAEKLGREGRELAEAIVNTVREPLVVLDGSLQVLSASRSFYRVFDVDERDTVGRHLYELGNGQWDIPALHELLETVLPRDQSFDGYVVEHDFPTLGRRRMLLNARSVVDVHGPAHLILLAMEDVSAVSAKSEVP